MSSLLTAGLLHRRGNPGTKGKLLAKSVEAYLLALETINRLTITYRVETFCALLCNSWELVLKAKILEDVGNKDAIYYPRAEGRARRSLSLSTCVSRVFPDARDSTRRNIECVEELRDAAVHLFISEVPKDVLGLLQASVLNYYRCLSDWFGVALADRIPVGMMSIVFDVSPERLDLSNGVMRRRLGKDAADYLVSLSNTLQAEHAALGGVPEFSVEIRYGLSIQKRPEGAAVIAIVDAAGTPSTILPMSRDPSEEYPYRQKELIEVLNAALRPARPITSGDVQAVVATERVKRRAEWFYQGKVKGSPGQYSHRFAAWFEDVYRRNPTFLAKARDDHRGLLRKAQEERRARAVAGDDWRVKGAE